MFVSLTDACSAVKELMIAKRRDEEHERETDCCADTMTD